MIGAKDRYLELVTELLLARAMTDDALPEDAEVAYVDELDRCWWAMTKLEQDEVERLVASQSSPDAPAEIGERDTMVARGAKEPPRKKIPKVDTGVVPVELA